MQVLTQLLAITNCLLNSDQLDQRVPKFFMKTEVYHMEEMLASFNKDMSVWVKGNPSSLKALKAWEVQLGSGGSGAAYGKETSSLRGLKSAVSSCSGDNSLEDADKIWNTAFLDSALEVLQKFNAPVVDLLNRLVLALETIRNRASLTIGLPFQEAAATLQAFRNNTQIQRILRRAVATVIKDSGKDITGDGEWALLTHEIIDKIQKLLPEQIRKDLQAEAKKNLADVVQKMHDAQAEMEKAEGASTLSNLASSSEMSEPREKVFHF
jgi:hypothetical protein